jgi:hypothetical protein
MRSSRLRSRVSNVFVCHDVPFESRFMLHVACCMYRVRALEAEACTIDPADHIVHIATFPLPRIGGIPNVPAFFSCRVSSFQSALMRSLSAIHSSACSWGGMASHLFSMFARVGLEIA